MSDLERRYLRLVTLFYPAGYRHARGGELVGTYLALVAPDRRWPSAADVIDLAGGGLRQRLREIGATGLGPGARLAATPALVTATALAGGWAALETGPSAAWSGPLGLAVWGAWLLAALAHLAAPGR